MAKAKQVAITTPQITITGVYKPLPHFRSGCVKC
jgi:hypothetical protein